MLGVAFLLAAIGAIAFFAFRLRGAGFDWKQFATAFRELNRGWLGASVVLLGLTYVGRALRWQVMMRPQAPNASFGNLLRATIIGFTAVTIFGRPGELVRPYLIAAKERVPFSSQIALWVLERIYDLLVVLVLFGFSLTQTEAHPAAPGSWLDWILRTGGYVVTALSLTCAGILVAVRFFSGTALRRMQAGLEVLPDRYRHRAEEVLSSFVGGMQSANQGSFVLQLLGYTVAEWLIIIACNYCLFRAFPATSHLGWVDNMVFVGFVSFGSAVQVPGIGGGFQVAAVLMLTEFFGLRLEPATAISLFVWLTLYVVVVPAGLILALRQGLKLGALRQIAEQEEQKDG